MKGKKLVFAVILSLIVCLLLVPSAFAEEQPTENNSEEEIVINDNPTNPDGDNGGSNPDPQNNESTDKPADSGDSESKNDSDNDSASDDEGQSGVNDGSSDESKDDTTSDDTDSDNDSDTDESDNDTDSEEEDNDNDSEEKEQENASEEETESDSAPTNTGDSNLPPQPDYTGFQVELTYNGKVVKMNGLKGGESHDFAQLMKELGIEGEVESAIGDADDLFNVTSDEKGMHFNTFMAFETKQKLVVTVGGVEYVIIVTDDGAVQEVGAGENLQDKITNAANGTTIKLKADFTGEFVIPEGKTITIDLNGKTLTNGYYVPTEAEKNNGTYKYKHTIINNGNLTIVGKGRVISEQERGIALLNYGTALLKEGTYEWNSSASAKAHSVIRNYGTMTIEKDATVKTDNASYAIINGVYDASSDKRDFNITATAGCKPMLTINGATVESAQNGTIYNLKDATLVINDGSFTHKGNYCSIQSEGNTTINGGTFDLNSNFPNAAIFGAHFGGSITVNKGTFTSQDGNGNLFDVHGYSGDGTVNVIDGTLNGKMNKQNNQKLNVTGGTYNDSNVKKYVGEDAVIVEENGKILVNPKAKEAPANTITLTNDAPVIKYWVVEGKDQTWTKSSDESIMFTLNSSAVTKVLVDGVEVEFEVDEDGKIVISAEVLEALEAGEHTVEFIFADGNCKTNIIIK